RTPKGLPDKDTLIKHIRESGETNKAEIAKAFGLKGEDRRALRHMLNDLEAEGALGKRGRRGFAEAGALPEVGVVDVGERGPDRDLLVRLPRGEDAPLVVLAPPRKGENAPAPGLGDRLLVRFVAMEGGGHEAHLIKALGAGGQRLVGVIRKTRRETRVEPVDRRSKDSLIISEHEAANLREGELVEAQASGPEVRYGPRRGKVLETIGREDDPRAFSILAIHSH